MKVIILLVEDNAEIIATTGKILERHDKHFSGKWATKMFKFLYNRFREFRTFDKEFDGLMKTPLSELKRKKR